MPKETVTTLEEIIDNFAEVLASTHVGLNMVSVNEEKKGRLKILLRLFSEAIRRAK